MNPVPAVPGKNINIVMVNSTDTVGTLWGQVATVLKMPCQPFKTLTENFGDRFIFAQAAHSGEGRNPVNLMNPFKENRFNWISVLWSVNGTSLCHYSGQARNGGLLIS